MWIICVSCISEIRVLQDTQSDCLSLLLLHRWRKEVAEATPTPLPVGFLFLQEMYIFAEEKSDPRPFEGGRESPPPPMEAMGLPSWGLHWAQARVLVYVGWVAKSLERSSSHRNDAKKSWLSGTVIRCMASSLWTLSALDVWEQGAKNRLECKKSPHLLSARKLPSLFPFFSVLFFCHFFFQYDLFNPPPKLNPPIENGPGKIFESSPNWEWPPVGGNFFLVQRWSKRPKMGPFCTISANLKNQNQYFSPSWSNISFFCMVDQLPP